MALFGQSHHVCTLFRGEFFMGSLRSVSVSSLSSPSCTLQSPLTPPAPALPPNCLIASSSSPSTKGSTRKWPMTGVVCCCSKDDDYASRVLRSQLGDPQKLGRRRRRRKQEEELLVVVRASSSSEVSSSANQCEGGDHFEVVLGREISKRDLRVATTALAAVGLSVANKVLYKMALVPLNKYPFFLAQVNTFGYVIAYSTILFIRCQAGIVTKEMLALPKLQFIALGALEALGIASGMAAAAQIAGASIPILHQVENLLFRLPSLPSWFCFVVLENSWQLVLDYLVCDCCEWRESDNDEENLGAMGINAVHGNTMWNFLVDICIVGEPCCFVLVHHLMLLLFLFFGVVQLFLVWQLLLSATILRKRYARGQILGCLLVILGVLVVVTSRADRVNPHSLQQSSLIWPLIMIFSTACTAGASILKEFIFQDAAKRLQGGTVDIFVVNSLGSSFQALFVLLLLPLLSNLKGIPFQQLPTYLWEGAACFLNKEGIVGNECEGAPLVPLLYILTNLAFNICNLSLLKQSSAVVSSLCGTLAVPLTIWSFTLPLPLLGTPASLPPRLFVGAAILIAGLASYNISGERQRRELNAWLEIYVKFLLIFLLLQEKACLYITCVWIGFGHSGWFQNVQ